MSKYYNVEGNKVVKKFNECPECGQGFFLAKHSDRESCGNCGYTKFEGKKGRKGKK
jgi:small subunit ribosomal protein S27Ae